MSIIKKYNNNHKSDPSTKLRRFSLKKLSLFGAGFVTFILLSLILVLPLNVYAYKSFKYSFLKFNDTSSKWVSCGCFCEKKLFANNQENANKYCNLEFDAIWNMKFKGFTQIRGDDGYWLIGYPTSKKPYVWAHLGRKQCVFNK